MLKKANYLYITTFFLALHVALPIYINSNFLSRIISESSVGYLYTAGSLGAIFALAITPIILKKLGNYWMLIIITSIQALAFLTILASYSNLSIILAFLTYMVTARLIFYHFDIFLESISSDETTGSTRGIYLTFMNIGVLIAPLIVGLVLTDSQFWRIYLLSFTLLIPIMILIATQFKRFADPCYENLRLLQGLKEVIKRKNILNICIVQLFLYLFYAWMVIYTPLYLVNHIGFTWRTIGIIFTIMLTPFVMLEWPLGRLADRLWGEKEMLNIGFIIMSCACIILTLIGNASAFIFTITLLGSRIGASMVEIMTETYFYKQIDATDAHLVSAFNAIKPIGYVLGPAIASLLFVFVDFRFMFMALGILVLCALIPVYILKDTK
jgi:MFS family permease